MFTDNCMYELITVDRRDIDSICLDLIDLHYDDSDIGCGTYRVVLLHPDPRKLYITFAHCISKPFVDIVVRNWYLFNTQSRLWNIDLEEKFIVWVEELPSVDYGN